MNYFSIKQKLFLIVMIPLVALLYFSVSSIVNKEKESKELVNLKIYLNYTSYANAFLHEIQKERGLTTRYVGSGKTLFEEELNKQRIIVDKKQEKLVNFISSNVQLTEFTMDSSVPNKKELQKFRQIVDSSELLLEDILLFYNKINKKLIAHISNIVLIIHDFKFSQLNSSYVNLIKAKEYAGITRAIVNYSFASKEFTSKDFSLYHTYQALYNSYIENFKDFTINEIEQEFKYASKSAVYIKLNQFHEHIDNKMLKNKLLLKMRAIAGYGGLIHDFKNYLLRGDKIYVERFNQKYIQLNDLLFEYKQISSTKQEHELLEVIQKTFEQYKANIKQINKLKTTSGIDSIDKQVKIDDTPALEALKKLSASLLGLKAEEWYSTATEWINLLSHLEKDSAEELLDKINASKSEVDSSINRSKLFIFLLLLLVVSLIILLVKNILFKLQSLQDGLISFLDYVSKRKDTFDLLQVSGSDEVSSITKVLNESMSQTATHIADEIEKHRQLDQEKLHSQEKRKRYLDTVIESNNNAIIAINSKGIITTFNKKAEKIFGWTKDEMIGTKNILNIIPSQYQEQHTKAFSNYFNSGDSCGIIDSVQEFEGVRKSGEIFPICISFGATYDTENTIVIANITDITKEKVQQALAKKLEEKVAQRTKELEIASRAKSDFLANMSHEIRTPLNGIIGFVDILYKKESDSEKQQKLQIIKESSNSLLTIINDILDFSKMESNKLSIEKIPFNIRELFNNIAELFLFKANEKKISISLKIDKKLPTKTLGDNTRVKQVFSNLLSNAIKFAHSDTTIYVNINYLDSTNELYCEIIDKGIGIDSSKLSAVFKTFEQADSSTTREYGGTGLGLSISKTLVELMSGKIGASSELNVGSKFYFILPLFDVTGKEEQIEIIEDNIKKISGKILVVEDNKTNQMLFSALLDDLGIEYTIVNNGLEAVEAVKDSKYDLVLMDENMPIMNGTEATKIIRTLDVGKNIPIIAVTANALKGDKKIFIDSGMNDYISKPINAVELEEMIKKYS
ncbi:MAG: nitrate- and nitrite sensing domain-containing protein [Sulfurimonas sp.]|nr:nitrate- and nitrite sensing domain-containing protein [Sulfurimonas sp.]